MNRTFIYNRVVVLVNAFSSFTWLFTIVVIFVSILIVLDNRNSSRTVAWLLILIFVPVLGLFLYLYIGQNHRKKKTFKIKQKQDYRILKNLLGAQVFFLKYVDYLNSGDGSVKEKVIPLLINNADSPITTNNEVKILLNGDETFKEIIRAIKCAKHHIHMEYFIIKDSDIGRRIQKHLIKKAKEGVEVRLIYDAVGSWELNKDFFTPMIEVGIKVKAFLPVTLPFFGSRLNYRNHRKVLVVDGKIGFLGGLNVGDEYLGKEKKFGFWRDTHLRITGEAIYVLQVIFLRDWFFVSKEELESKEYFPSQGYCGVTPVQITASGPDVYWQSIHQGIFTAISSANKCIYITTPYLVPDESILLALKTAALRGVDVRVLMPHKPDHRTVFCASKSYYMELLETGVKIYQYKKGFIHSKTIVIDDDFTTIGTTNIDIRSFQLNFEVNAFVYNSEISAEMKKHYFEDLKDSTEITLEEFSKRSVFDRMKESLARLFSPIL